MIDKAILERILSDNIPCVITCGHCECEVELDDISFDKIYEALVKAEKDEIRLEQHESPEDIFVAVAK